MAKKREDSTTAIVPPERIEQHIYLFRSQKVLLSTDLAKLYGVPVKQLNQAVTRNLDRFPLDFMFQLNREETEALRSQIVTLKGEGQEDWYWMWKTDAEGFSGLRGFRKMMKAISGIRGR